MRCMGHSRSGPSVLLGTNLIDQVRWINGSRWYLSQQDTMNTYVCDVDECPVVVDGRANKLSKKLKNLCGYTRGSALLVIISFDL